MFVSIYEFALLMNNKISNNRVWVYLTMPMILLTLKMMSESIYKNEYPLMNEEGKVMNIIMDKIFHLADSILDPNKIFGRFLFLESDFRAK
jgi:hypothetical protein